MGRTNAKKLESREARLKALPQSQRLAKSAAIKKKEGRVLTAAEKHAVRMTSDQGEILRLWEKLRTSDEQVDNAINEEGAASNSAENLNNNNNQNLSKVENDEEQNEEQTVKSLHRTATSYAHKHIIIDQLLKLIEPKFESYVRTPSMSRVVQSMIKHGNQSHFAILYKCLSSDFVTFATDAYAHFTVNALIRHASHSLFEKLFTELIIPSVSTLVSHKFGITVLHSIHTSRWCTFRQRQLMIMSINKDDMSVMAQWNHFPELDKVIWTNPEVQRRLLTRLFEVSDKLVSQKDAIGYPMVQQLVYTYMQCGIRDEVKELCDTVRPSLHLIVNQHYGSMLTSLVFVLSEAKKRKELLRSLQPSLFPLALHKYGAPVIARMLDYMYDVQLLHKYIADELERHFDELVNNSHGYLILMHLLTPHMERKRKFLPSFWLNYNLYSVENTKWNQHTWLDSKYNPETVELCDRAASYSHLNIIPFFVSALLKTLSAESKNKGNDTTKKNHDNTTTTDAVTNTDINTDTSTINTNEDNKKENTHNTSINITTNENQRRHHLSLLAREVLLVRVREAEYKRRIPLTDEEVLLLQRYAPARELTEIEKKLTPKQVAMLKKSTHLVNAHRQKTLKNAQGHEKVKGSASKSHGAKSQQISVKKNKQLQNKKSAKKTSVEPVKGKANIVIEKSKMKKKDKKKKIKNDNKVDVNNVN